MPTEVDCTDIEYYVPKLTCTDIEIQCNKIGCTEKNVPKVYVLVH